MTLYALDPGTEHSALVCLDANGDVSGEIRTNAALLAFLRGDHGSGRYQGQHLVIEEIQSYGMAVGREVFETVFWAGRFAEAWAASGGGRTWSLLGRREVKLALCGSARAKDPNIRQALIDRYGGKASTKKGGPLAGIKSHLWAALAVGVTYREQQQQEDIRATHSLTA